MCIGRGPLVSKQRERKSLANPLIFHTLCLREIVRVENICLVRLLNLTADFGVKTNAKLTPIFKLVFKTGIQSCLYTVSLTPIFVQIS